MLEPIFRSFFLTLLLSSSTLIADITSHLHNYTRLDCKLEEMPRGRHGQRPLIPAKVQPKPEAPDAIQQVYSTNWSGYAVATNLAAKTGKVTAVSGSWVVPQLNPTSQQTYSSFWVGIDGYSSNSVEQLGTESDWNNGQHNYAWIEMFPNFALNIVGFPVNIGDVIEAEVEYLGANKKGKQNFLLSIVNHTHQAYFTKQMQPPTSAGKVGTASAEWIAEAPEVNGRLAPLANFQTGVFSNCTATINGVSGGIVNGAWQTAAITMVSQSSSQLKAVPSSVSSNGESFSVTWENSGP